MPRLNKTAAVGTWRRAEEFAQAGELVCAARDVFEEPLLAYFLFCHAIELALKSFLIGQGCSDAELRTLSHDLEETLSAAEGFTDFASVQLSAEDRETIRILNPYYRGKEFEYLFVGFARFPVLGQVQATSLHLLRSTKPLAWRAAVCAD